MAHAPLPLPLPKELESYSEGKHAFTFEIEDVAGNSFIEGPDGGAASELAHLAGALAALH